MFFGKTRKIKIAKIQDETGVFKTEFDDEGWQKIKELDLYRSLEEKRFMLLSNLFYGIGNKISFNDKDNEVFVLNTDDNKITSISLNAFEGEFMELSSINEKPILLLENGDKIDIYSIENISEPKLINSFTPPVGKKITKFVSTDDGLIILITVTHDKATNLYEIIETSSNGKEWNIAYSSIKFDFVSFDDNDKKLYGINKENDLIILDFVK